MRSSVCAHCVRPAFGYAPISRFSRTVSVLNTCRPSGTWAMPRCARSDGRRDRRLSPSNVIVPDTGDTTPLIVLKSVDFPAPFGPTSVTNRPPGTDSVTSVRARKPPYATERPFTSSIPRPRPSVGDSRLCILARHPLLAEIGLDHGMILDDGARQAGREDAAMIEHDEPVGQAHHGVHRVLDDADRDTLLAQPSQHVQDVVAFLTAQS